MQLINFSYWEERAPGERWEINGLEFGQFNLIVGRNATGKTRLLKAIARAAAEQSGEATHFAGSAGINTGLAPDVREDPEFPEARHATGAELAKWRQEASKEWGSRLQYFPFAGRMNFKTPDAPGTFARWDVAEGFKQGLTRAGTAFQEQVSADMTELGYPTEEVVTRRSDRGNELSLKETKREALTPFKRLSQGEQRALTLLTFLALLDTEKKTTTILIDDFAEGLDFERAARAAEFVLRKAKEERLQFIVATNDRYVMNTVPLEHWTVLVDEGNRTQVYNVANSKSKFEDFKFTGLNNFDFFSMDFGSPSA